MSLFINKHKQDEELSKSDKSNFVLFKKRKSSQSEQNTLVNDRKERIKDCIVINMTELEKKIIKIQRSTKTFFKRMIPIHHFLRMKYSWYDRWHQSSFSTPTHWLALVTVVMTVAIYSVTNLYWTGSGPARADEPITFQSSNALYSGDFEGVNGVAGMNLGWKSDDTARSSSTDFGWDKTNFTRDAHGGDLAYEVTIDTAT